MGEWIFLVVRGTGAMARGFMPGLAAIACAWCAAAARADDTWPASSPEWLSRDAAGGLAILPMACWWAWIAAWSATSDWIFRDSARFKIRPEFWTACAVFPFAACCLLAWWIPWSAAGQTLMALAWILPLFLYSRERNPKAPAAESIFTRPHLQRSIAGVLQSLGVKTKSPEAVDNGLPWVRLLATLAETPEENEKWQNEAAAMPGFNAATTLLQEAVAARASTVIIEMAADGLKVGHEVDGIPGPARAVKTPAKGVGKGKQLEGWADAPPLESAAGNAAVAVLRIIAGADAAKLSGEKDAGFTIEVDGKKRPCRLATRATKTAKQVVITLETPPFAPKKLEDLGMASALANQVRELIALEKGLFLVSSPPATGCTTTFDAVLSSTDRLLRDFVSIEDSGSPPNEVQNVKPVRYSAAAGESPVAALKTAMLEYPRAVVTRDLTDRELAGKLLDLADDQQLVLVSMRAADSLDAIQKLIDLGVPPDQLARCLLGSLSQRIVRKLCVKCGSALPTPPELLQRLKKTAEELPEIKRASPQGGCRACAGRQFVGRTAIYELAAGPTVRQAIAKQVDAKVLRQAAVKDGMRPLAEEGLAAVAYGLSSLEEMQRVFAVKPAKKEAGAAASPQPGAKPVPQPAAKPGPQPGAKK
jgi:type II secretory ATPase GspE/PulE/Tfp pilus assembly ATPase PilB-like protein